MTNANKTFDRLVKISPDVHEQMTKLSENTGLNMKQIADAAIRQFLATSTGDVLIIRKPTKKEPVTS